jgi:hypothetical protein
MNLPALIHPFDHVPRSGKLVRILGTMASGKTTAAFTLLSGARLLAIAADGDDRSLGMWCQRHPGAVHIKTVDSLLDQLPGFIESLGVPFVLIEEFRAAADLSGMEHHEAMLRLADIAYRCGVVIVVTQSVYVGENWHERSDPTLVPRVSADPVADWVLGCSRPDYDVQARVEPFDEDGEYSPHVVGHVTGSAGDILLTVLVSPDSDAVGQEMVIPAPTFA